MKKQLFNLKKLVIVFATALLSMSVYGQMQIDNSGFETWDNPSTTNREPTNWSSFMTADCTLGSFMCGIAKAQHVEQSTDKHSGTYSARIWSTSTIGIVANGNLTLGRVHMGSATATDASNYNYTDITNPDFNQVLTDKPDSLVAWVKFNPQQATDTARVSATIHDAYNYRDPEDANATPHVVAKAVMNYPKTNGQWVRLSIPFDYVGPSTNAQYILITFTTNMTAGGGKANDEVFIDDVKLIYNPTVDIAPIAVQNLIETQSGTLLTATEHNGTTTSRQWKYATTSEGPYTNAIAGATGLTYTPLFAIAGTYYVICESTIDGITVTSNEVKIIVEHTTGITENTASSFVVYATDKDLNVDFSKMDIDNASLCVLSIEGKVIAKRNLEGNKMNTIHLSVPTGIYFYSISNGKEFYQGKVFIK